jgi:anti-anti-sigma factor
MAEPQYQCLLSRVEQGVLVLTITKAQLEGDEVAALLRQEMDDVTNRSNTNRVVVDFQHTTYISSVAFWPLLSLWSKIKAADGRLILCGLSPMVGDVFYTTRLVSPDVSVQAPFQVEEDVEAAIAKMNSPVPEGKTSSAGAAENLPG